MKKFSKLPFYLKSFLKKGLARFGLRVIRTGDVNNLEAILYDRLMKTKNFFFLQIGGNDGITFDPIYSFVTSNNLSGIIVEPIKEYFMELEKTYQNYPEIIKVNAAIHGSQKAADIYRIAPSKQTDYPVSSKGIASFNPEHHKLTSITSEHMVKETVNCLTLNELILLYGVKKIDLLQIDTEGYDYEIIKMINFKEIKPQIIHFEHFLNRKVMSMDQMKECINIFLDNGYYVIMEKFDAIAYIPK